MFLILERRRTRAFGIRQLLGAVGLAVVLAFFAATVPKVATGGWAPVGIGGGLFLVMWTWWTGRQRLAAARSAEEGPPDQVLAEVASRPDVHRVPGTAVYLTEDKDVAPFGLRATVEFGRSVLHEHIVMLSWRSEAIPRVTRNGSMSRWRQRLFPLHDRVATDRVEHLELPRDRAVITGRDFDL